MAIARKLAKQRLVPSELPQVVPALSTEQLSAEARRAAEEILLEGQAENTLKSYRSALRYWCAWAQARYGKPLAVPVPVPVVLQFIVDHTARKKDGKLVIELPRAIDTKLVEAGFKGALGPLKMATISHLHAVEAPSAAQGAEPLRGSLSTAPHCECEACRDQAWRGPDQEDRGDARAARGDAGDLRREP